MIRLLLSNHILITGIAAWGISQFLKIIIYTIINREFVLERLFGDGGMPSSHSATVTSVAIASGRVCGWDSPVFAVAVIVAINEIIEHLLTSDDVDLTPDKVLKEFVGHTPLQVAVGFLLGVIVAMAAGL